MNPAIAILCNPDSGRVRPCLDVIRRQCALIPGSGYLELDGPGLRTGALTGFLDHPMDALVVVGGDGTLHGVLTALSRSGRLAAPPAILVVPAGTTNMSTLDFGNSGRPHLVLERFLNRLSQQALEDMPAVTRPVLRVSGATGGAQCGMFFGAGVIARGVEHFSRHVRDRGITGEWASALVMVRFLGALLGLGRSELVAPVMAQISGMPGMGQRQPLMAILASTLDRLLLGFRPYWGTDPLPIHFTAVRSRPRRLWRSLAPLLRGQGAGLDVTDGYASVNVERLELELDGPFVMDGQCYEASRAALALDVAGRVRFLRP